MTMSEIYCWADLETNCRVRGRILSAVSDCRDPVAAFLGIPYAEPPIGMLRFKHSEPLKSLWQGTRDALDFGKLYI